MSRTLLFLGGLGLFLPSFVATAGAQDLRVVPIAGEPTVVRDWEIADSHVRGRSGEAGFALALSRVWRLEPQVPPAASTAAADDGPFLLMRGGARLAGRLVGADGDSFRFALGGGKESALPRAYLRALRIGKLPDGATDEGFEAALAKPPADADWLYLVAASGKIQRLGCRVTGFVPGSLQIEMGAQKTNVPVDRVYGVVFGDVSGIEVEVPQSTVQMLMTLHDGRRLRGAILRGRAGQPIAFRLLEGIELELPLAAVREIELSSERLLYLSALPAAASAQPPVLGRAWPVLRDQGLAGEPLQLGDRTYRRGFLVVPAATLRFELPRPYDRLVGEVGMPVARYGGARLRLLAGGRALGEPIELRADGRAIALDVPLQRARDLTLEVLPTDDLDAGAIVVLGELRVIVD